MHDIIYNANKTKCICIRPKSMINMCDPVFVLSGNVLACIECQNYLEVKIMFTMLKFNIANSREGGKWLKVSVEIVVKVSNADYFKHSVQLSTAPQYVQDSQLNLCGC